MPTKPYSITDVRKGIERLIYSMDGQRTVKYGDNPARKIFKMPQGHIYPNLEIARANISDNTYPKAAIIADSGGWTRNPGNKFAEVLNFFVFFILKQVPPEKRLVEVMTEDLVDDFMNTVEVNDTLYGVCTQLDLIEWNTDSGFTAPEGTTYFHLSLAIASR